MSCVAPSCARAISSRRSTRESRWTARPPEPRQCPRPYPPVMTMKGRLVAIAGMVLLAACSTPRATGTPEAARPTPSAPPATSTSAPSQSSEPSASTEPTFSVQTYPVPAGSHPHDVAPAADGGVWYTAQGSGELGWLNPSTGEVKEVALGTGSAPHGVIVGPDGAPWITDGGLNAIVRVDPRTSEVKVYRLPASAPNANLNTAIFDKQGILWFTGQAGYYGRLNPSTGEMQVSTAPRGRGPYGITVTPGGDVYYASLAGNHIARINRETGQATPIDPPTVGQGARRVWSDSR